MQPKTICFEHSDLSTCLVALTQGDHCALDSIARHHQSDIETLCHRLCDQRGVPWHQRDDVRQELYCRLLRPQIRNFDPDLGTAKNYLIGEVLNAISYAKRRRRRWLRTTTSAQYALALDEASIAANSEPEEQTDSLAVEKADLQARFAKSYALDLIHSVAARCGDPMMQGFAQYEQFMVDSVAIRCATEQLIETEPPEIRVALHALATEGVDAAGAADRAGISASKLSRARRRLSEQLQRTLYQAYAG